MTAYFRGAYQGSAAGDGGNIRGGTAHFQENTIGNSQKHHGGSHTGRRSGQNRQNRTLAHGGDVHDTAIGAHDHNGSLNSGSTHAFFRHIS